MGAKKLTAAQRRNAQRLVELNRDVPTEPSQPAALKRPPRPMIAAWGFDKETKEVTPVQRAMFWHSSSRSKSAIDCDLCYRKCTIEPGQVGWCRYRANDHGKLTILAHGVISTACKTMRAYGSIGAEQFRPGARAVWIGGTFCTSRCVFCASTHVAWDPERLEWAYGRGKVGQTGGWALSRAMLHPEAAVDLAREWKATDIHLGVNEPLLSFEYSLQVAQLAKHEGLIVSMDTNGFSTPEAVRKIAPFVDMANLGIKGSLDPEFYEKRMRAPGATPAVKESIRAWSQHETFLMISDVIAPPQMQSESAAEEHQARLYGWIAEEFGPLTPLYITGMRKPVTPGKLGDDTPLMGPEPMLDADAGPDELREYVRRIDRAVEIAKAAGLLYVVTPPTGGEPIRCHNCGGVLFNARSPMLHCAPCTIATHFCPFWRHEQHVTESRCDHCGTEVPFVVLTLDELKSAWGHAEALTVQERNSARSRVVERIAGDPWPELEPTTTARELDQARERSSAF